jgi:hypothetical protein
MPAFGRESLLDTVKDKLEPNTYDSARNLFFNNWKEYERIGFLNGNQISTYYYSPWGPDHFVALPFLDAPPTTSLCKSCSEILQQHWDPSTGPKDDWTDFMPCGIRDNLQEDDLQELTNSSKKDKYPARETNPWLRIVGLRSVENINALHSSARYCGICRASYYTVLRGYHPRNEERVGILFDYDIRMRTGKVQHLNIEMKVTIDSSSDPQQAQQKHISCKGFFELYTDGGTCLLSHARRRLIIPRSRNHCSQPAK